MLLDGGFVTKKLQSSNGRAATADDVVTLCDRLRELPEVAEYELLRIYYYDAWPADQKIKRPISGQGYSLAGTERFRHSQSLFDQLVMRPGFALRMGETRLKPTHWNLKHRVIRELKGKPRHLTDADFDLDVSQKGVDLRIGMDMARLALRELVRAVVVVTADSDFVPVFKFVRREGVKIILDTMGHRSVRPELKAHADFLVPDPA
jgi:uncharacterized LabA/DUF88 family protein